MSRRSDDYQMEGMSFLQGALIGALAGAAAIFLADDQNRRRLQATIDDWKEKGSEKIEDAKGKVEELKQEGLEKASQGLDKAQNKLNTEKRRPNGHARTRASM